MYKKITAVLLALMLFFSAFIMSVPEDTSVGVEVSAATEAELKNKQAKLEQEQKEIKSQISALQSQQADAQSQVDEIDKLISNLQEQIDTVNAQINAQNAEIAELEAEIAKRQKQIDESYEQFKARVRAMYISGDLTGGLELLLCANDFQDFLSRMVYIEAMAAHDQGVINTLTEDQHSFEAQKALVEEKKAEVEKQKSVLSGKKAELDEQKAKMDALLAVIAADKAALQEEQAKIDKEMAAARAALDAIVAAETNKSSAEYVGGGWMWPAPGYHRITSNFGWRAWSNSYHKGIDIGAPKGAIIVASNAGKVVVSSYDANGYGNYLIVDHGGGYMTVYAHLSKKSVSIGQSVSQGTTLGLCGSTGRSNGPHLHFEIRVNGTAKNPVNYL